MLEVIATSLEDALRIEEFGGDRIELVSAISEGGLTPSIGLIKEVTEAVHIPVMVMVRPHSKSFQYSEQDMRVILEDIHQIKKTKAKGIVFGSLTEDNHIDFSQLEAVLKSKGLLEITVHRAIDSSKNLLNDVRKLCEKSVDRILSSGGEKTAELGKENLLKMIEITTGFQTKILVGSGVNVNNIQYLKTVLQAEEFHVGSAAKTDGKNESQIDEYRMQKLIHNVK